MEALEREVAREERMREFVREALAADTGVEQGRHQARAGRDEERPVLRQHPGVDRRD